MKEYLHCKGRKIQPTPANSARGGDQGPDTKKEKRRKKEEPDNPKPQRTKPRSSQGGRANPVSARRTQDLKVFKSRTVTSSKFIVEPKRHSTENIFSINHAPIMNFFDHRLHMEKPHCQATFERRSTFFMPSYSGHLIYLTYPFLESFLPYQEKASTKCENGDMTKAKRYFTTQNKLRNLFQGQVFLT
jgi:hypothetical protein